VWWWTSRSSSTSAAEPPGHETLAHRWIAPAEAVACRDRGEVAVVAPTWVSLHTLAQAATMADALALAAGRTPVVYRSRTTVDGDRRVVLWDGDAGYAIADPHRPGRRHRLVMADTGWQLERT
jgi:hypothetical protein